MHLLIFLRKLVRIVNKAQCTSYDFLQQKKKKNTFNAARKEGTEIALESLRNSFKIALESGHLLVIFVLCSFFFLNSSDGIQCVLHAIHDETLKPELCIVMRKMYAAENKSQEQK